MDSCDQFEGAHPSTLKYDDSLHFQFLEIRSKFRFRLRNFELTVQNIPVTCFVYITARSIVSSEECVALLTEGESDEA